MRPPRPRACRTSCAPVRRRRDLGGQTVWEDKTVIAHAELAGLADQSGDTLRTLTASGMSHDAAVSQLNNLVESQSVMIATNQLMFVVAIAFAIAAFVIWLAPRPSRAVDAHAGGH